MTEYLNNLRCELGLRFPIKRSSIDEDFKKFFKYNTLFHNRRDFLFDDIKTCATDDDKIFHILKYNDRLKNEFVEQYAYFLDGLLKKLS